MDSIPLWAQALALVVLLAISAFFSIAETSMMALNRFRLGHLVKQRRRGARRTQALLARTEQLLGTILLGNNLVNTALTTIVTALAIRTFGNDDSVLAIATAGVALAIIIFCEITPKVIGATHPERIALPASWVLTGLMTLLRPAVWAINLVVNVLLKAMGVRTDQGQASLSPEELKTLVLESTPRVGGKHRAMLVNLFELEDITVGDVMVPRHRIESLDLTASDDELLEQLTTCHHNTLPCHDGEVNRVIGLLHVRRALALLRGEDRVDAEALRRLLVEPYFVPAGTPAIRQLQFFQENRQRVAMVVDEWGEVHGLVTLEDIVEEIVGEFTTSAPGTGGASAGGLSWGEDGTVTVEGSTPVREINRRLGTAFPTDGPRTIGGLVLEVLRELPEAPSSVRIGDHAIELLAVQDRAARSLRLRRLRGSGAPAARGEP